MFKIIGIVVIFGSILGGFMWAGGNPASIWQPSEFLIIIGSGIGALMVGYDKHVIQEIGRQLKTAFGSHDDAELHKQIILLTSRLLEGTRQQGPKFLDAHIEDPANSSLFLMYPLVVEEQALVTFMTDNLRLLSMGKIEAHELEGLLEKEIDAVKHLKMESSHAIHAMSQAMPGFGIMAAVLGIVITMGHIDGPVSFIGYKVSAALIGTFFGIFMCYGFLEPLNFSMNEVIERDVNLLNCTKEVLVAFASGKPPILALDSGRRLIPEKYKPTFSAMEAFIQEEKA